MKEKIKYLVLGILIGAVITAGVFSMLKKDSRHRERPNFDRSNMSQFDDSKRPQFDESNMPSDLKEKLEKEGKSLPEAEKSTSDTDASATVAE